MKGRREGVSESVSQSVSQSVREGNFNPVTCAAIEILCPFRSIAQNHSLHFHLKFHIGAGS